jgi:hypothetical protein
MDDLSAILRRNEVETLLHNAHLLRDWPDRKQKAEEAQRLIRTAMYEAALGRITNDVKQEILTILYPLCPDIFYGELPPAEQGPEMLG